MRRLLSPFSFLLGLVLVLPAITVSAQLVIAHRGASGYLPEHTLEAKVLAFAQGADFLEQDVVMTADDALVVFHDLTLERTTDVETMLPARARSDGSWYVIDFTLAELRQLSLGEGTIQVDGTTVTPFPDRFPPGRSHFTIHTFQEELELIQGLERSLGRQIGIYPELKSPWFHHQHGKDLSAAVLQVLKDYGYDQRGDRVFVQSFDYNELRRISTSLLPVLEMELPLVQLIADNGWGETQEQDATGNWINYNYDWMHTREGMERLAEIVAGLGPALEMLVSDTSAAGTPVANDFVSMAHAAGLQVHPFTFRLDRLPAWAADFPALLDFYMRTVGVDGVFTDFPDLVVTFLADSANP
jgi:glycerophosphoryl diester phosphodiesterase